MAYSELIKNFESIRGYMREFYVFGFKCREEVDIKSARSYDNERRRIESWLGDYMSFHQTALGKAQFISVDSRTVAHNPLYQAFQTKTFTDNDIILHFYLLDLLQTNQWMTFREVVDGLYEQYFNTFIKRMEIDDSTIRNKLKEYVGLGLIRQSKQGKNYVYALASDEISLHSLNDAIAFYSEANPMGVIGATLLKKEDMNSELFLFKHHYILYALDSEILCSLLDSMSDHCRTEIEMKGVKDNQIRKYLVYPHRIYVSTQTGREYLLGFEYKERKFNFYRLDHITSVKKEEIEADWQTYEEKYLSFKKHQWGVAGGTDRRIEHVELVLRVEKYEQHIVHRLEREKRNGIVEQLDENTYRYVTDTRDTMEMLPWIRTFIGRIISFTSSNKQAEKLFFKDMESLYQMYLGGDGDGI